MRFALPIGVAALLTAAPASASRDCDLIHDALAVEKPIVFLKCYGPNCRTLILTVAQPLSRPAIVKRVYLDERLEYAPIGSLDAIVRLHVERVPGRLTAPNIEDMPMMAYAVSVAPRSLTMKCGPDTVHRIDRIDHGE